MMRKETFEDVVSLLVAGASVSLLYIGGHVVAKWHHAAMGVFKSVITGPSKYMIVGVWLGFLSKVLHSSYWAFPWASKYLGLEYTDQLLAFSVFPLLPFNYVLGIAAGYCHIKALVEFNKKYNVVEADRILANAAIYGLATCAILSIVKGVL